MILENGERENNLVLEVNGIMRIAYCMVTLNRKEETQFAVRRVAPYVDNTYIVDGGSTDGTIEWLESKECKNLRVVHKVSKQYRYATGNHTPKERQKYLDMLDGEDFVLVTDSDEFLEETACKNLYRLAEFAESRGFSGISFRAHDKTTYENGDIYDNVSNYWNPMFFKMVPGTEYRGHTHSHIYRPGISNAWIQAGFEYEHVKHERKLVNNSTYLFWTTCKVADNDTTSDPEWGKFHELMAKHGHLDWHEFNKEMSKGGLPEEIKKWFMAHKDDENPEKRSWFEWYFIFMHPEENVDKISSSFREWDYVEQSRVKREGS